MTVARGQFVRELTSWGQTLRAIVATWQTERPKARVGFAWLSALVAPIDDMVSAVVQAVNDWGPGSDDASPTALALAGQSRGLIQGEDETDEHFAARLVNWRTNGLATPPPADPPVWSQLGKTLALAQQIQEFVAGRPTVQILERIYVADVLALARVCTANPDGTTSESVDRWNWDGAAPYTDETGTHPTAETGSWWSDFWIVVTPPPYARTGTTLAALAPIWGNPGVGLGHAVPRASVDAILRIVRQGKGAHTYCRAIVWSYGTGPNPRGRWGQWGITRDDGSGVDVARPSDCRFWIPRRG